MKTRILLAGLASVLAMTGISVAQVSSTRTSPYEVVAKAGPYMVLAHTYKGADAKKLAEQHAYHLRKKYRIPAWIVSIEKMRARYGGTGVDVPRRPAPDGTIPAPVKRIRVWDEAAVLVGGYAKKEDALSMVTYMRKKVTPPHLVNADGTPAHDRRFKWVRDEKNQGWVKREVPCAAYETAFVIRNPALPKQKVQADPTKFVDPKWKELNEQEEYSLLKNPKAFTLVVQQFQGLSVMQNVSYQRTEIPGQSQSLGGRVKELVGLGDGAKELDRNNANQAHAIASLLRKYNFDAYVLHTRNSSLVTVGGFDSLSDPRLRQTQIKLGKLKFKGGGVVLRLFERPAPMRVPRVR